MSKPRDWTHDPTPPQDAATPSLWSLSSPELRMVQSAIDKGLRKAEINSDQLITTMAEICEELVEQRHLRRDPERSERLLQTLLATTQRLESLVSSQCDQMTSSIQRGAAALSVARGQLWEEARAFKREMRRDLHRLFLAPLAALLLFVLGIGILWRHGMAADQSKDSRPVGQPIARPPHRR